MIADLTIVNADINASAAIALSKLATGALPSGITVASANIVDGTIVNADINASAAIADTKLATISTAGKVSGTAITSGDIATSGNIEIANDTAGGAGIAFTDTGATAGFRKTRLNRDGDSFAIKTELSDKEERTVSSTFSIKMNGYIIPDVIQKDMTALKKISDVVKVVVSEQVVSNINNINNNQ